MKFINNHRKVNARTIKNMKTGHLLLIRNGTAIDYESGYLVDGEKLIWTFEAEVVSQYLRTECKTGLYAVIKFDSYWKVTKMIHAATKKEASKMCKFTNYFWSCKTGEMCKRVHE